MTVLLVGGAVTCLADTGTTSPKIRASVASSAYGEEGMIYEGMYEISADGSAPHAELKRGVVADGGGVAVNGRYYAVHSSCFSGSVSTCNMTVYDEATWEVVTPKAKIDPIFAATDVALDPVTGEVYGCYYKTGKTSDGYVLAKVDYERMTRTVIADLGSRFFRGVAIDRQGQMYAVDDTEKIYRVNKTDGTREQIGSIASYPGQYMASACFDMESGFMYQSVLNYNMNSYLLKIDVTDGSFSLASALGNQEQLVGMYIPFVATADGAPAAPGIPEVTFQGKELSGSVKFTLPAVTFGGSPLQSQLTWHLLVDGDEVTSGQAQAGSEVNVPFTVAVAGNHTFSVYCSNAEGDSPRKNVPAFAGSGTPEVPADASASFDETTGTMTISWSAVTASADGGYIEPLEISYSVTRLPDNITVASGLSACSVTDEITGSELKNYTYAITASYDGNISAEAVTPAVSVGSLIPPYNADFTDKAMNANWTIINNNKDLYTWTFDSRGVATCRWNSKESMDDWLITPPVTLESGKCYRFSFNALGSSYIEKFSVSYGASPTVEGMAKELIPVTEADGREKLIEGEIIPETSGRYYIGIHGCSDKDKMNLKISDFKIAAPVSASTPGEVRQLSVTPDATGALKCDVSFTLPELMADGTEANELTAVTGAEISCDGVVVATITEGLDSEAPIVCHLDNLEEGIRTFAVAAVNHFGRGKEASVSAFIGINVPESPENVVLSESSGPGTLHVAWDAVAIDADGYPLNPGLVVYDILTWNGYRYEVTKADIAETSADIPTMAGISSQALVSVAVQARTSAGKSPLTFSNTLLTGEAYTMPYLDDFRNGEGSPLFAEEKEDTDPLAGNYWSRYEDDPDGVASPYHDGGLAAMSAREGEWARLFTGRIKVQGENAALTFYAFNCTSNENDNNTLAVEVRERGGEWTTLRTITMHELGDKRGWYKVIEPLAGYAGKEIQIGLKGTVVNYAVVMIDELAVSNLLDNNLAIKRISAPDHARPGQTAGVELVIENSGMLGADNATLSLTDNNSTIYHEPLGKMNPGEIRTVEIPVTFGINDAEKHIFQAKVENPGEQDIADNISAEVGTTLILPRTPVVTDLAAVSAAEGIELSWNEPELSGAAGYEDFEDFESYSSWENESAGDWKFVDRDGLPLIGFKNFEFPFGYAPRSWWVNDDTWEYYTDSYAAHSGHKYLAQMSVVDDGYPAECNDFAISPRLDGSAQTVSLWVRRCSPAYAEAFDILVTDTENPDRLVNFRTLKEVTHVPDRWTEMFFDLPEGSRYFAIRCCSYNALMLFVDDITFIPAESPGLTVEGYNVYCDDKLLTEAPVTDTSFTHTGCTDGESHEYYVTTVYSVQGESLQSNKVVAEWSSLRNVEAPKPVITTDGLMINVSGCCGQDLLVTDTSGCIRYHASGRQEYHAEMPAPGMYIVKCGASIMKVVLK